MFSKYKRRREVMSEEYEKNQERKSDRFGIKFWRILAFVLFVILLVAIIIFQAICFKLKGEKEEAAAVPAIVVSNDTENAEPIVKKYTITNEYLKTTLEKIGELATSKGYIQGVLFVEDGNVAILTKNSYSMIYTAEITAGIDISEIEFEITDTKVIVTLPSAKILNRYIDPNSIQFYDIKKSIFNPVEYSDSIDGLKLAENDLDQKFNTIEILNAADKQAEELIDTMLSDFIKNAEGERNLVIKHKDS